MARSSCPKCDNHTFQLVEAEPANSAYKFMYVQCSSCGAVVGVMDYFNIGTKIERLEKEMAKEIKKLQYNDEVINNNLIKIIQHLNRK